MSDSVYAVVAYVARYWFVFLAVVIFWRAIVWLRQDADRVARAQRRLPDAGYIGEWAVVASDAEEMPVDRVLRAPSDGWIGSARACDVRLRAQGVPARAARFFLKPDGLHLQPQRSGRLEVDGEPVRHEAVMRHGATLTIGGVTLQLRLFAGVLLEGEAPAAPIRDRKGRLVTMDVEPIDASGEDTDAHQSGVYIEEDEHSGDGEAGEGVQTPMASDAAPLPVELPAPSMTTRKRYRRRQ